MPAGSPPGSDPRLPVPTPAERTDLSAAPTDDARRVPALRPPGPEARPRHRLRSALTLAVILAAAWALLTGGAPESWALGLPTILAGAALVYVFPPAPGFRISPLGALHFGLWFAVQSVRGAIDVSVRAFDPRLPLAPGFRDWRTTLPEGAPRVMLANTVSLLPGTLTAELEGDRLVLHLLDVRADLATDMGAIEARLRGLFALPEQEE